MLTADCTRCFGLCCVALPFARSSDFPINKAAGTPCRHLQVDFRCGIHDRLRDEGFRGCAVYDCFGAGQRLSQETFGARDWRIHPELASSMFAALPVMVHLHEMLLHLDEAAALLAPGHLATEVAAAFAQVDRLAASDAETLVSLDLAPPLRDVGDLLGRVSELVRSGNRPADPRIRRGADLAGADLSGRDLRQADLRGALLIAADLSSADLGGADLLGADLRDANLAGAELAGCLFLTDPQVRAARGDAATSLPTRIARPAHWPGGTRRAPKGSARRGRPRPAH